MTDDKALELYEQCDRELPDRGDLGSFKRLIGAFARALLATLPAAALAPVAIDLAARMEHAEGVLRALPKLEPTISIANLLAEYGVDDREEIWESIQAIADIRARQAILAAPTPSTPAPVACEHCKCNRPYHDLDCPIAIKAMSAAPPTRPDVGEAREQVLEDESDGSWAAFELSHHAQMSDKMDRWPVWLDAWHAAVLARPDVGEARDAARYRHIRATTKAIRDDDGNGRVEVTPEGFDAAVDAAMRAPQSSEKEDQVIAAKQGDA